MSKASIGRINRRWQQKETRRMEQAGPSINPDNVAASLQIFAMKDGGMAFSIPTDLGRALLLLEMAHQEIIAKMRKPEPPPLVQPVTAMPLGAVGNG